ncbi:hypothetical protein K3495_g10527 [Podosphaera aphanis]|nr:hypothetical protein K3495_g10527 [Podosphaera aphanis]
MHEIITLQLGQKSNYLATHFWNIQESYFTYSEDQDAIIDHDTHFRTGIGSDGSETFTPRTVIYDLKGGFGSLRKINALYEIDEPVAPGVLWNGPAVTHQQAVIPKSDYQRSLEQGLQPNPITSDSIQYWSDFNRVFFHPKSIVQLNEFEISSSLVPYEKWSVGEELFESLDKEHDILDRDLRPFIEEADHMQAIQIITGTDDAWGGFAARYLDRVYDEYGKTPLSIWGLEENLSAIPREKRIAKLANSAKSIAEIAPQATLFTPIALPSKGLPRNVTMDQNSQWHVSALLSLAVETMTLPSRLKPSNSGRATLDQLFSSLNVNGNQKIAMLRMSIDPKATTDDCQPDKDQRISGATNGDTDSALPKSDPQSFDIDFFPTETGEQFKRRPKKKYIFSQLESHRIKSDSPRSVKCKIDKESRQRQRRAAGLTILEEKIIPLPFTLVDSFPHIFAQSSSSSASSSFEVSTSLSTDTTVALKLKNLQHITHKVIIIDEREALSNTLGEIAEAYRQGWDSGTDDDDD